MANPWLQPLPGPTCAYTVQQYMKDTKNGKLIRKHGRRVNKKRDFNDIILQRVVIEEIAKYDVFANLWVRRETIRTSQYRTVATQVFRRTGTLLSVNEVRRIFERITQKLKKTIDGLIQQQISTQDIYGRLEGNEKFWFDAMPFYKANLDAFERKKRVDEEKKRKFDENSKYRLENVEVRRTEEEYKKTHKALLKTKRRGNRAIRNLVLSQCEKHPILLQSLSMQNQAVKKAFTEIAIDVWNITGICFREIDIYYAFNGAQSAFISHLKKTVREGMSESEAEAHLEQWDCYENFKWYRPQIKIDVSFDAHGNQIVNVSVGEKVNPHRNSLDVEEMDHDHVPSPLENANGGEVEDAPPEEDGMVKFENDVVAEEVDKINNGDGEEPMDVQEYGVVSGRENGTVQKDQRISNGAIEPFHEKKYDMDTRLNSNEAETIGENALVVHSKFDDCTAPSTDQEIGKKQVTVKSYVSPGLLTPTAILPSIDLNADGSAPGSSDSPPVQEGGVAEKEMTNYRTVKEAEEDPDVTDGKDEGSQENRETLYDYDPFDNMGNEILIGNGEDVKDDSLDDNSKMNNDVAPPSQYDSQEIEENRLGTDPNLSDTVDSYQGEEDAVDSDDDKMEIDVEESLNVNHHDTVGLFPPTGIIPSTNSTYLSSEDSAPSTSANLPVRELTAGSLGPAKMSTFHDEAVDKLNDLQGEVFSEEDIADPNLSNALGSDQGEFNYDVAPRLHLDRQETEEDRLETYPNLSDTLEYDMGEEVFIGSEYDEMDIDVQEPVTVNHQVTVGIFTPKGKLPCTDSTYLNSDGSAPGTSADLPVQKFNAGPLAHNPEPINLWKKPLTKAEQKKYGKKFATQIFTDQFFKEQLILEDLENEKCLETMQTINTQEEINKFMKLRNSLRLDREEEMKNGDATTNVECRRIGKDEYLAADPRGRIELRKKEIRIIKWFQNEDEHRQKELQKFLLKIEKDAELTGFEYFPTSEENRKWNHVIIARKIISSKKPKSSRSVQLSKLMPFIKCNDVHTAPESRVLITDNITFNDKNVIKVFSDIGKKADEVIPKELVYDYNDKNKVDGEKEKQLEAALKMAERPHNHIKCDCHDKKDGPLVPCYLNPTCQCFQMNDMLKNEFQNATKKENRTGMSSLNPILLKCATNTTFDVVGFACSELCGCHGKCTNNPLLLAEKWIFPIEMYRSDANMGFNLRSPVIIPAGIPFSTFSGEIETENKLDKAAQEYSFQIWRHDEDRMSMLLQKFKGLPFDEEYRELLSKLFKEDYSINPLHYGNIGRTAGHSCAANVMLLRIWQKSLSPAHITLIMVPLQDIIPGTPITIDYGADYAIPKCLCNTFACKHNKDGKQFRNIDFQSWSRCLHHQHELKMAEYMENVIDPMIRTLPPGQ